MLQLGVAGARLFDNLELTLPQEALPPTVLSIKEARALVYQGFPAGPGLGRLWRAISSILGMRGPAKVGTMPLKATDA